VPGTRKERLLDICKDITRETDNGRFAELVFDISTQLDDVFGDKYPGSSPIPTDTTNGRDN
jgi:hypothetical protein